MGVSLFRDSIAGQAVRWVTGDRLLSYPDQPLRLGGLPAILATSRDDYIGLRSQSSVVATHGLGIQAPYENDPGFPLPKIESAVSTAEIDRNRAWASPTDPENPYNWSTGKKVFVASQIW